MSNYNQKSCNALEKPYYRPIEAALRWCGLINHESEILQVLAGQPIPAVGQFPRWPCLQVNTEKIFDAINHHTIPHGRDGSPVGDGDHVTSSRRTVRHDDLKKWMSINYPNQKPLFLFDEIEQGTHTSINIESFRSLQADRDALKTRIDNAILAYTKLMTEKNSIEAERDSMKNIIDSAATASKDLSTRERNSLLKIIGGACLGLELDLKTPSKAAGSIESLVSQSGQSLDSETITNKLKQVATLIGVNKKS